MLEFEINIYNNPFLPDGATEIDAVVEIVATDDGTGAPAGAEYAEVIIIDGSGSMGSPVKKIMSARDAAADAIHNLPDGALFAVIRGTDVASVEYPGSGGLARATATTRAEAKAKVATLRAEGKTAIGRWLTTACELFADHPTAIRHAILLTDGRNEHETDAEFAEALAACDGRFTCDPRGVGRGWAADELNRIAGTLHGRAAAVVDPHDLIDDFRDMTRRVMGRVMGEVFLRIWVRSGATVGILEQAHPTIEDLTGRGTPVDTSTTTYPIGAWGTESRDYHLVVRGLQQPTYATGPNRLARVELASGAATLARAAVLAQWTSDRELFSSRVSGRVDQRIGQIKLLQEINLGTKALRSGDTDVAANHLGRAVAMASASGDQAKLDLLAKMVVINDPAAGLVRVRDGLDPYAVEVVDLESRYTEPGEG